MREYGQIQCSYWQRACEEEWSNDAMLLGAYLLTGPHSNGIGCYRLPTGYVSDDLNWSADRVEKGFAELVGKGFANRFGRVVLVPKFLRWNSISNGNVAKARQQEFEAIPNDEAKKRAALALLEYGAHWEEGFVKRLETLSKGLPKQNPTPPNPNPPKEPLSGKPDLAAKVFEHWQQVMGHQKAKLDDKRRKRINTRLKDGYTVDDLKRAIDGCKKSPHHMGDNERNTVYDGLELICRDAEHVDKFIAMAEGRGLKSNSGEPNPPSRKIFNP